jgi:hypothetical protein
VVILSLSPRSYVTEAFDLLYMPFSEYIYNTFVETGENWWDIYIHKTKKDIFEKYNLTLPKKGSLINLRAYYDELALFKLVLHPTVSSVFMPKVEIISISNKLKLVRNNWAHREKEHTFSWADKALELMINLVVEIGAGDVAEKIRILYDRMHVDIKYRDRKIVCSSDDLKMFLENELFLKNEALLSAGVSTLSKHELNEVRRKIKHSREMLDCVTTAEGVIAFFWNAIIYKNDSFEIARKFGVTFEEKRDEFDKICYG